MPGAGFRGRVECLHAESRFVPHLLACRVSLEAPRAWLQPRERWAALLYNGLMDSTPQVPAAEGNPSLSTGHHRKSPTPGKPRRFCLFPFQNSQE